MANKMPLEECRHQISQLQRLIRQLINKSSTSMQDINKLSDCQDKLADHANKLSIAIMKEIGTDSEAPGQRIKTVTHKVENAINDLQRINKVLGVVTGLVDIFGTIVAAVSGGQPLVAISSLLNGLERTSAEL